ncbi:MAG TPA: sugar transferase [Bryobacteraceae bacterium]|nr:sugar transferase [Bryobacteraceae bacterium]
MAERSLALCILIILSPILCVVGLLVLLDSPGPVLFRQWRVGAGGRLFRFTKFRTYFTDARERFPELYNYSYGEKEIEQVCFKVPNDPRATRVGAWLRQTTLDELPNFWHVLTGHMALVGPRPEIPEMLPHYRDGELRKFTVRPGVTGLAQISGRGNLSFRETVAFDLAYVENQSLLEDLRILLKTAQCVVFRRGAF